MSFSSSTVRIKEQNKQKNGKKRPVGLGFDFVYNNLQITTSTSLIA